jgi:hypothetical protein
LLGFIWSLFIRLTHSHPEVEKTVRFDKVLYCTIFFFQFSGVGVCLAIRGRNFEEVEVEMTGNTFIRARGLPPHRLCIGWRRDDGGVGFFTLAVTPGRIGGRGLKERWAEGGCLPSAPHNLMFLVPFHDSIRNL